MATMITSECINCGACEPECPNTAIYQGGVEYELDGKMYPPLAEDIFYIVPEKCTECVGFYDHEACAAVCPVDCCVPNPDLPETEEQLIERARRLHPDVEFPADFPSRFRKQGAPAAAAPQAETKGEEEPVAAAQAAGAATADGPAGAVPRKPAPPPATAAKPTAGAAPRGNGAAEPGPPSSREEEQESALPDFPPIDSWEVPVPCHTCGGRFAVRFGDYRTGSVLRCPYCQVSLVITGDMYGRVRKALEAFQREWTAEREAFRERRERELREFEQRQQRRLEELQATLARLADSAPPPGTPRRRRLFG